ncbi:unnamed protein product [Coregonus sp. 'balchen']|nr:unnamed protein product [Coregonus sp. 'balchen']
MSSASREHVHQLGTTQAEPETSITSVASTTQPDDAPASQSAPAQVNLPASQSAPAQVSLPASQSAPAQCAPAQVNLPASQSAPAQVRIPASQSAPAQVSQPASQSASQSAPAQCAPAQVNLPASQSAPAQVRIPTSQSAHASQSAPPRQPSTTAILIDSNGKFLVQERLFPRHQCRCEGFMTRRAAIRSLLAEMSQRGRCYENLERKEGEKGKRRRRGDRSEEGGQEGAYEPEGIVRYQQKR